jgi:hypothetical protein
MAAWASPAAGLRGPRRGGRDGAPAWSAAWGAGNDGPVSTATASSFLNSRHDGRVTISERIEAGGQPHSTVHRTATKPTQTVTPPPATVPLTSSSSGCPPRGHRANME